MSFTYIPLQVFFEGFINRGAESFLVKPPIVAVAGVGQNGAPIATIDKRNLITWFFDFILCLLHIFYFILVLI
tara:strand:- start:63 stop:281 length:219 start_codon:yes stop_codon:yes gene_type:complete